MSVQEILVRSVKGYGDKDCKDARLRLRICPKCGGKLEKRPGMFFSRAVGGMDGLVCTNRPACKALWNDPDNSFLAAHARALSEG